MVAPSFNRLIKIVHDEWGVQIFKQDLLDLEEDIIRELDFELHFPYPILFLERYQRIFGLENVKKSKDAKLVNKLARDYCKLFLKESSFLKYKPSTVAAAAFMCAYNICQSSVAPELKMSKLSGLQKHAFFDSSFSKQNS